MTTETAEEKTARAQERLAKKRYFWSVCALFFAVSLVGDWVQARYALPSLAAGRLVLPHIASRDNLWFWCRGLLDLYYIWMAISGWMAWSEVRRRRALALERERAQALPSEDVWPPPPTTGHY